MERFGEVWRGLGVLGKVGGFEEGWRFWGGLGEVLGRVGRVLGKVGGFGEVLGRFRGFGEIWRFWRFWGGLEVLGRFGGLEEVCGGLGVMQRQVLEPGLSLGVHTMIHQPNQAVSPRLLLPGQSQLPAWPRDSVFPGGMSRAGACWGQCSAESVETKSSLTENPRGHPTGQLSPKLLAEPWGQLQPHRWFIPPPPGV